MVLSFVETIEGLKVISLLRLVWKEFQWDGKGRGTWLEKIGGLCICLWFDLRGSFLVVLFVGDVRRLV